MLQTLSTTGMVLWVFVGAYCFKGVFVRSGGPEFVTEWVASLAIAPIAVVGLMQISFIIMGCL